MVVEKDVDTNKEIKIMKNIVVLAILLLLFIIPGCVDSYSGNEENAIETILLDLIDSDDAFGIDGFDSDGCSH